MVQGHLVMAEEHMVTTEKDVPKGRYEAKTDYDKLLEEFDKPKPGLFHDSNNEYGPNVTAEEFAILNEMKIKNSKRMMLENDGTKTPDQYEDSEPVPDMTNFNGNWSYYFPQRWGAYGDPFVVKNNKKFVKSKDFTGHAALGGENRSTTLETAPGRTLGWENNKWFTPANKSVTPWTPGTHLYYAVPENGTWAQLGVHNASLNQYKRAHDYGQANKGAPYNWTFQSWGPGFYCSELVVFAWRRGAGIDIIPQYSSWNMIWPIDIYKSPKTYIQRGVIY